MSGTVGKSNVTVAGCDGTSTWVLFASTETWSGTTTAALTGLPDTSSGASWIVSSIVGSGGGRLVAHRPSGVHDSPMSHDRSSGGSAARQSTWHSAGSPSQNEPHGQLSALVHLRSPALRPSRV